MTKHQPHAWHEMPDEFIAHLSREASLASPIREAALEHAAAALRSAPLQVVDLGSGIGADAAALATRFPEALVHAVDVSPKLLERVASTAEAAGVADRVVPHRADLNQEWSVGLPAGIDLAWASLSLHHLDDPAQALRHVYAALRPGGVLVATELSGMPRLSPDDLGTGIAGISERIGPLIAPPAEYANIDWQELLDQAGFSPVTRHEQEFTVRGNTPEGADYLEQGLLGLREHATRDLPVGAREELDAAIASLRETGSMITLTAARTVWVAVRGAGEASDATRRTSGFAAEVAIIGGGAAGLSAAVALARSRRDVVVIDAGEPRNAPASGAHNLLGQEGIPPLELLTKGRAEAEAYGAQLIPGRVTGITGEIDDFTVEIGGGAHRVRARRIILASGLVDDLPDIPGIKQGWGRTVLHCPFCHGWEVRGQRIAILARDEVALHQAVLFRQLSDQVTVFLHDAPDPTDEQQVQLEALGVPTVRSRVSRLVMEGALLRGVETADGHIAGADAAVITPRFNARTALYESLGGRAEETPFGKQIPTDPRGMTHIPGVWAAGNANNAMAMVAASAAAGVTTGTAVHGDLAMADLSRAVRRQQPAPGHS